MVQRLGPGTSFHFLKGRDSRGTVLFLAFDHLVGYARLLRINITATPDTGYIFRELVRHRVPNPFTEKLYPSPKTAAIFGTDVGGGNGIVRIGGIVLACAKFSRILLRRPAELPGELLEGNVRKPCVM